MYSSRILRWWPWIGDELQYQAPNLSSLTLAHLYSDKGNVCDKFFHLHKKLCLRIPFCNLCTLKHLDNFDIIYIICMTYIYIYIYIIAIESPLLLLLPPRFEFNLFEFLNRNPKSTSRIAPGFRAWIALMYTCTVYTTCTLVTANSFSL